MDRITLPILLLLLLAAPAATAQSRPGPAVRDTANQLRPGDVVQLQIWREPTLSGKFQVHEGGTVVFPKIGALDVTDESPASLQRRILEEYRYYLRNPSIEITLLRRVRVMGAVRQPGLYPIDPTLTVADALALAGGPLSYGDPDEVQLVRDGRTMTAEVQQEMQINALPVQSGDHLYVPERSWISRHSGLLATFVSSAVSLFIAWELSGPNQ